MAQEHSQQYIDEQQETEALITISIAGSDSRIQRRGAIGELIGERSLDLILSDFLDTSFLNQVILNGVSLDEKEKRAAEEIASLLSRDYQVMVRGNDGEEAESPIVSPSNQLKKFLYRHASFLDCSLKQSDFHLPMEWDSNNWPFGIFMVA